jgi:hypothetical protein
VSASEHGSAGSTLDEWLAEEGIVLDITTPAKPAVREVGQTNPVVAAVQALAVELEALRAERDDYRARWLRQVDANDRLRARLAHDAERTEALEAMGRE